MQLQLSGKELVRHRDVISQKMDEEDVDGLCLFSPRDIFYLTSLYLIQTERPVGLLFDGETTAVFVPTLEREHIEELGGVDDIITYDEYPGEKHPVKILANEIKERKFDALGVDSDSYPGGFGYEGPALSELLDLEIVELPKMIERVMQVKSNEEIELIKESCRWGNLAHRYLQDYTAPGKTENEIVAQASFDASQVMLKTLGGDYYSPKGASNPAHALFRGQIGESSAIPHALNTNEMINEGDVLITGAAANVGGYVSELERTMIVGEPAERQIRFFKYMVRAGEIAMDAIKPGNKFSEVDQAVWEFYTENDLGEYWRHHTGHSIGFGGHEAPYFDRFDDRELEEGMAVTVEPGLYVSGFAGFRHSDTILVTKDGCKNLTYYPRDLDSLTVSVS